MNFDVYLPITSPTLIFCVVLLIILFAPIIMGKLRIPHIVGMVLAGILIGKYGLNILERDSSFELFGKVGLLYIMFLAGLEMDLGLQHHTERQGETRSGVCRLVHRTLHPHGSEEAMVQHITVCLGRYDRYSTDSTDL